VCFDKRQPPVRQCLHGSKIGLTVQPPSPIGASTFFDVGMQAEAFQRQFVSTQPIYYVGAAIALGAGPILGLFIFAPLNGKVPGVLLGLGIGTCLALPLLVLARRLGRGYPTSLWIGGGILAYSRPGSPPHVYDFRKARRHLKICTFNTQVRLAPTDSIQMLGKLPGFLS